jgi:hypothetical protein
VHVRVRALCEPSTLTKKPTTANGRWGLSTDRPPCTLLVKSAVEKEAKVKESLSRRELNPGLERCYGGLPSDKLTY